jgi:hypothetical protein
LRTTGRPLHRRSHRLEDGSTAPPGFFGTFFPVVERVNALKGPGGATIAKPDINLVANMAAYSVTTQKKILGANYGLSVIFPVVNTRFTANLFNASAESAGLSDRFASCRCNELDDRALIAPVGPPEIALARSVWRSRGRLH